jgi:glycosyltransferase involved in cell wall biosynthesis
MIKNSHVGLYYKYCRIKENYMKKAMVLIISTESRGLVNDTKILQRALNNIVGIKGVLHFTGFNSKLINYLSFLYFILKAKVLNLSIVAIHLEQAHERGIQLADLNVFIPNQECFNQEDTGRLSFFDRIWTKTSYANEIFKKNGYDKQTEYIGFTSQNSVMHSVHSKPETFLHIAGKSKMKGTQALLNVWSMHPELPRLTVVTKNLEHLSFACNNVAIITDELSDHEIATLQNESETHICASEAEGFGHYISEALSCGAIVVTTNGPPMNDIITKDIGFLADYTHTSEKGFNAQLFHVCESSLYLQIKKIIALSFENKKQISDKSMKRYSDLNQGFHNQLTDRVTCLLNEAV